MMARWGKRALRKVRHYLTVDPAQVSTVQIYTLFSDKHYVKLPISITVVEYDEDDTWTYWQEAQLYGFGPTPSLAIMNIKIAITDDYNDMMSPPWSRFGGPFADYFRGVMQAHVGLVNTEFTTGSNYEAGVLGEGE